MELKSDFTDRHIIKSIKKAKFLGYNISESSKNIEVRIERYETMNYI